MVPKKGQIWRLGELLTQFRHQNQILHAKAHVLVALEGFFLLPFWKIADCTSFGMLENFFSGRPYIGKSQVKSGPPKKAQIWWLGEFLHPNLVTGIDFSKQYQIYS